MTPDDEKLFHACRGTCSGWEAGREFGQREQIALEATAAVNAMHMELQEARAGLAHAVRNCDAFEDQRDAALSEVDRLRRAGKRLALLLKSVQQGSMREGTTAYKGVEEALSAWSEK